MDSFFGRNGTLDSLMEWNNNFQALKSNNAVDRAGALGRIVSLVMSLL